MDEARRERFRKVEDLFERVCDLEPGVRARVLDEACSGDDDLRREVLRLLEADREAGDLTGLVGEVAGDVARRSPASEAEERRIGPYRVLGTLGHGGMGVVYRAVRDDDEYSKEVAIKVISPVRAGEKWVRRFREERSILARLDHPNVARLLDGGSSDDGLPYVVMEYVEGRPIDRWCEERQLDLDDRLGLFRQVCAAVHEAHRNLVVHRDLKPANVLVGEDGRPRLLDFGIAKLIEPDTAEAGAAPPTATRMMTPEYASPEQILGRPVSTASDVYSLGVLLYELLAGTRPYRLDAARPAEIERLVCEVDPPPPSAARADDPRSTGTTSWRRRLRGDLDRIVAVAMHKDPARRYASVEALSEDLRRFLEGLPVAAREDTWGYRTGKFVRRHRVAVAAAAVGVVLLAGFGAAMARQSARIADERDRVEIERGKAEEVAAFVADLFRTSDETGVPGRDLPASELLARGVERLRDLEDQPLVRAELLETIGDVYLFLDMLDEAEPLLHDSLALRLEHDADPLDVATSYDELGKLAYLRGQFDESIRLKEEGLALRVAETGEDSLEVADSLHGIGAAHQYLHHTTEARDAFERAVDIVRRNGLDEEAGAFDRLLGSLGGAYRAEGRLDEAEQIFRELLDRARRLHGEHHIDTAEAASSLATLLRRMEGREAEAEPLYRLAIDVRREALGRHTSTAQAINNYAVFLRTTAGRPEEAGPLHHEALEIYRENLGEVHPDVGLALVNVATWERDHGDPEVALATYDRAASIFEETVGATHWLYWAAREGRARTLRTLAREDEAVAAWTEAVAGYAATMGPDHPRTTRAAESLARWLDELGRDDDAAAVLASIDAG